MRDLNTTLICVLFLPSRDSKRPKYCIELSSQAVGLIRVQKNIVVACSDQTLQGYTQKVVGMGMGFSQTFFFLGGGVLSSIELPDTRLRLPQFAPLNHQLHARNIALEPQACHS